MSLRSLVRRAPAALILAAAVATAPVAARAQAGAYSLDDIVGLVRNKVPAKRVLALAKENCISFSVDDQAEARLRRAGATSALVTGLKDVCGPDKPKVAAADTAKPPAPPPPPVDTTFQVTFRAAIIGSDLTVKPVPLMDLWIIGPRGDTTHTSTDLDGSAAATFKEGVYRIESAHPVTIGDLRYHWAFYQPFSKDMRPVELTQKNAVIDTIPQQVAAAPTTPASPSAAAGATPGTPADTTHPAKTDSATAGPSAPPPAPAKPAHHENPEREIFAKYRSGVFTVYGVTRGSGFLADSAGLVVTNAHLVKGADEIRVQTDSVTKVYARPLVVNDASDIAVLAITMSHCGQCAVLPLFDSTKTTAPAAGDRVLALGSPLNRLSVLSIGIVSSASDQGVVSDASVNWLNTGGPLVNLDGYVIGVNSTKETDLALADVGAGPRVASSTPESVIEAALAQARDSLPALSSKPVSDSLLPVVPSEPFPKQPIDAVSALPQLDLNTYRTGGGPFRVLVMTPQVMAWRQKQADRALAARKRDDPQKAARWQRIDPIEGWRDWRDYLDEQRAVVIVNVTPERTAFPFYDADKIQGFDEGSVRSLTIFRDGVPIVPVEKVRIPAVLDVAEEHAAGKTVAMQAIYVYRIRDFAPRAVGTLASYKMTIVDALDDKKSYTFVLPGPMIEQLWKDFTPYQFSR